MHVLVSISNSNPVFLIFITDNTSFSGVWAINKNHEMFAKTVFNKDVLSSFYYTVDEKFYRYELSKMQTKKDTLVENTEDENKDFLGSGVGKF